MSHASSARAATRDDRRTPAQWYCLLAGLSLLLAGVLGFISDSSFTTGDGVQGDLFVGFEVNAIHNIVHIASGLLLLAASPRRPAARAVALGFGAVYGLVAVIGIIDGEDVLGLIPINAADNVLHVALAALGIISGLMSRADDGRRTIDARAGSRFEHDDRAATRGEHTRR
jgi:hypothetical protein